MSFILIVTFLFSVSPTANYVGLNGTPAQHLLAKCIADGHGLDPLLVWAIIQVESNWDSTARSSEGCLGLMQLNHRYHGVKRPEATLFRQAINVEMGCAYLVVLRDMYPGSLHRQLTAYNYGPNHWVTRIVGTSGYAERVLALVHEWGGSNYP